MRASAKLALLDRLLHRLRRRGDRVLLFSQSTMMLDVLQDYLHMRRWAYERLDGSARAEERWAAVASFQGGKGGKGGSGPWSDACGAARINRSGVHRHLHGKTTLADIEAAYDRLAGWYSLFESESGVA